MPPAPLALYLALVEDIISIILSLMLRQWINPTLPATINISHKCFTSHGVGHQDMISASPHRRVDSSRWRKVQGLNYVCSRENQNWEKISFNNQNSSSFWITINFYIKPVPQVHHSQIACGKEKNGTCGPMMLGALYTEILYLWAFKTAEKTNVTRWIMWGDRNITSLDSAGWWKAACLNCKSSQITIHHGKLTFTKNRCFKFGSIIHHSVCMDESGQHYHMKERKKNLLSNVFKVSENHPSLEKPKIFIMGRSLYVDSEGEADTSLMDPSVVE